MTSPAPQWPADRYQRRLALRLRRQRFHAPNPGDAPAESAPAAGGVSAEEIEAIEKKYKDQIMRHQAEFDNFRRRSRKEKDDMRQVAAAETLEKLLPVIDNFSRALSSPASSLEGFVEGVKMIHSHFLSLLRDAGLEAIQAKGQPFDPNFHEAVAVDDSGEHPDNTVVETLQDGYMLKGKLLRPAMVKVARSS